MDFTSIIGTAIAKLDFALIGAIYGITQVLKVLDPKDKLVAFYSFVPLVLGMGAGFLLTSDWKSALLTGFIHGAVAAWLYTFIKNVFGLKLPGDKKVEK